MPVVTKSLLAATNRDRVIVPTVASHCRPTISEDAIIAARLSLTISQKVGR